MKNCKLTLLLLAFACVAASAQQIAVNKDNRTIAVTATDKATADADTAVVHIGFQVFAPDEKAAYALGSKTSNAITDALKKSGVPASAIESEAQNIARVQPYEIQNLPDAQKAERQFQVSQSWNVKTSAKNASTVLDTAVQAGANQSGQIEWTVADENALEAQAADSALKRARQIADQMAKGLGTSLGTLIYASNQVPERPVPLEQFARLNAAPMAAAKVEPLAISPQKVTRSATVYAVFAIE